MITLPAPHVNSFSAALSWAGRSPSESRGRPGAWELVQCGGVCSFGPAKGVPPALCRLLGSCPFGSLGETTCPRPVEVIVDIPPSPLGCKTCKPPFLCWWHHSNYLIFKFFTILNTEWYLFGLVAYLQSTPSIYRHNLFFTCLWRNIFYFISL